VKRAQSLIRLAALVLAAAVGIELIAAVSGPFTGLGALVLLLTIAALVLVISHDALDQFR
jgi:hypothetical protein